MSTRAFPEDIPGDWKTEDCRVFESHRICVVMHPRPTSLGHLIIFPKRKCRTLQDADKDDLAAIGLLLPDIKRAVRIVTGFRCFGMWIRSGPSAWSGVDDPVDQLHVEFVPTIAARPGYVLNWDPDQRRGQQLEGSITRDRGDAVVRAVRCSLGLRTSDGAGTLLLETERFQAELVSYGHSTGHCMISPKRVSPDLEDADAMDLSACMSALPRLATALQAATGQRDLMVLLLNGPDAGQRHAHVALEVEMIPSVAKLTLPMCTRCRGICSGMLACALLPLRTSCAH